MGSRNLFYPLTIVTMSICFAAGCSKKPVLDREVKAGTIQEFTASRESLIADFSPVRLKDFDTAIQEVKFDAMNNGVASVALRDEWMRAAANGKSVQQVLILGWQARHSRLQNELNEMSARYAHDSKLLTRHGSEDSTQFLKNVTRNEEDKIAQLKSLLSATDQKLTEWGATPAQISPPIQMMEPKTTVVSIPGGAGNR